MILRLISIYAQSFLAAWAYSFQTFSVGQVLTASQMNQVEVNVRDHLHGRSGVLAQNFTSSDQTITSAGALTIAHGLGVTPTLVAVRLRCTTAEGGYSIGDLLFVPATQASDSTVDTGGVSIVPDATNLNIRFGSRANVWTGTVKNTGGAFAITNANWVAVFFAWVI